MNVERSGAAGRAVFLSYASQDAEAAKRICDALRAAGVEVWFDQSELRGGDAWDAMIRKRIKECSLFVPIITPNTNARAEGYFRLEWKLAVDRSHLMADDAPFLFPIVLGDVTDATARVPDKFREVQWTRLRLDETPGELAARVARLLTGNHTDNRPLTTDHRAGPNRPARWQWWMIFPILGTIMGLMFAAVPLWKAFQGSPTKRTTVVTPDPKSQAPDPKPSEARQLAAKARALIDAIDSNADDFAAAEGVIKRAIELDATDGEVWAVSSRVNSAYLSRGFERSTTRRETARSQAERAVKLAPDLPEAWLALGRGIGNTDAVRAEEALRRGLTLAPEDGRLLLGLGSIYRQTNRFDEALVIYEQAAALPETRALARYDQYLIHFYSRRFAEADRCLRESISISKSANMVAGLALLEVTWRGDIAQAQQALADAPASMRGQTRLVLAGVLVNMMAGQPDAALRDFDRLPADYVNDAWYTGPKGLLVGLAHYQAGRPEAARIAWESGLAVVRRRLQDSPNDLENHLRLGELLAWTGQTEAALQEARIFNELQRGRSTDWTYSTVRIHAALGRVDDALPLFEQLLTAPSSNRWPLTPALLRIDPLWSKLRGDPRFLQLVTRAELAERAALPLRVWPKHPELKKAIDLVEGTESIPDDFALAEQIVKPIVERAPTDLEAVTVMARVQSQFMRRGFDRSDERSAQARLYGERALQLDPNEPEAMLAVATYLFSRTTGDARAERLLRRAMELDPANPRHGRMLADLLNVQTGRQAEALAQSLENVRRFPRDALSRYDLARHYKDQGRYEEFDRELDAVLALTPLPNAIAWKARLQFGLHNDFAGMKRWLDQVPERVRGTERTVFGYFLYAAFGGDTETGLEALRAFTQKWFTDFEYGGPTALLNADLLVRQGKAELARQQYEAAWLEIQRMRTTEPARIWLNQAEFWTLLGLDRKAEARQAFRRLLEGQRRPYAQSLFTGWWFTLLPGALLIGERDTALELMRECVATLPEVRGAIRVRMQLDPRMAPFRDDPEIKALLAEPGSETVAAPLSEAGKLTARTVTLYSKLNYTRENLAIAEDLGRKATELEPDSAAAWGARAGVQATYLYRNWDASEKRRQDTQAFASRALGLNPDEPEALLALGHLLRHQGVDDQAIIHFRRALAAAPANLRAARALGTSLSFAGQREEGRAVLLEAVKADPQDALVRYDLALTYDVYFAQSGLPPTEVTTALGHLDAGLAVQPLASLLTAKAVSQGGWLGDVPALRTTLAQLEKLPLAERAEDRSVFVAMWGALLGRDPARAAAAAALTAKNYFQDSVVPRRAKDWSLAIAHRLEGKENLARLDWQRAETVLRQRLSEDPNNLSRVVELATALAWLGRTDEALQLVAPAEAAAREEPSRQRSRALADFYAALGDAAKAVPHLRQSLNQTVFLTSQTLVLDPWFDKLRGQPEFEALLKEAGK